VRAVNRELEAGRWGPGQAREGLAAFDGAMSVLDIVPRERDVDQELRAWVEARIADRQAARRARDFARADAIRAEVAARGVELEDTPGGTRWRVRTSPGA
jgi:cysteinyl-tRNA synthetase